MSTSTQSDGRTLAMGIFEELEGIRKELRTLREFANLLGSKDPAGESFMDVTIRLLGLLIGGTEETHSSLRSLHGLMTSPAFASAMRSAIQEG